MNTEDSNTLLPTDVLLRPSAASRRMGFSIKTFWNRRRSDPDFPALLYDIKTHLAYVSERAVHSYRNKRLAATQPGIRGKRARNGKELKRRLEGERLAA